MVSQYPALNVTLVEWIVLPDRRTDHFQDDLVRSGRKRQAMLSNIRQTITPSAVIMPHRPACARPVRAGNSGSFQLPAQQKGGGPLFQPQDSQTAAIRLTTPLIPCRPHLMKVAQGRRNFAQVPPGHWTSDLSRSPTCLLPIPAKSYQAWKSGTPMPAWPQKYPNTSTMFTSSIINCSIFPTLQPRNSVIPLASGAAKPKAGSLPFPPSPPCIISAGSDIHVPSVPCIGSDNSSTGTSEHTQPEPPTIIHSSEFTRSIPSSQAYHYPSSPERRYRAHFAFKHRHGVAGLSASFRRGLFHPRFRMSGNWGRWTHLRDRDGLRVSRSSSDRDDMSRGRSMRTISTSAGRSKSIGTRGTSRFARTSRKRWDWNVTGRDVTCDRYQGSEQEIMRSSWGRGRGGRYSRIGSGRIVERPATPPPSPAAGHGDDGH